MFTARPVPCSWADYFVDDMGIVGMYAGPTVQRSESPERINPADWVVAPITEATLTTDKDFYVLGRDTEIRFDVTLPAACEGRSFAVRLYGYPDPGVGGGIQAMTEPGLMSEARSVVPASGTRTVSFNLPTTASTPMIVRPGLLSSCLSDIAVQGELQLALLAPPEDSDIAIIEYLVALDLNRGVGQRNSGRVPDDASWRRSTAPFVNRALSRSIASELSRQPRFPHRDPDQPSECSAPGERIIFLFPPGSGESLEGKPLFVKPTARRLQRSETSAPSRSPTSFPPNPATPPRPSGTPVPAVPPARTSRLPLNSPSAGCGSPARTSPENQIPTVCRSRS